MGEDIPMEGFIHWIPDELGRFSSVQRATKGEGTPQFGHFFLWFLWQGSLGAFYVYRFHCISLLFVSLALIIIYRHISQIGFPLGGGGGLSRVMLTKNTCVQKCMC
jgi:hypothetical protein